MFIKTRNKLVLYIRVILHLGEEYISSAHCYKKRINSEYLLTQWKNYPGILRHTSFKIQISLQI